MFANKMTFYPSTTLPDASTDHKVSVAAGSASSDVGGLDNGTHTAHSRHTQTHT